MGFLVAQGPGICTPSWGGYYTLESGPDAWDESGQIFLYDEVAAVRATGGDVVASLGGAASIPLEVACPDASALAHQLRIIVDTLGLKALDFDVEGAWLADDASVRRRNAAIMQLQTELAAEGRTVDVWFTLPVLPTGITPDGEALLADALAQGVAIAGVNVMTMDYGDGAAPDPEGQMGTYAIEAVTALHAQMTTLWQDAGLTPSPATTWSRIGATPMIGLNDVLTETFTLDDAAQLRAFAVDQGMGLLSMWSVNRDHPCPDSESVQLTCSSTEDQTEDWQFIGALGGD